MIYYFTPNYVEIIHNKIIEISGGRYGYSQNPENIEKVDFMRNDDYYSTFEDKLAYLVYSINKNHIFADGNKRTSIGLGAYFLEINGYNYCVNKFIIEMENIAVAIADNKISRDLLKEIIYSIIYEYEFSEELKLEIINSIGIGESEEITKVSYNNLLNDL
ncbi:MAG: type II toxin-antitoxin system death-on-curing family toxin [Candidatus Altimarinota bacterium]